MGRRLLLSGLTCALGFGALMFAAPAPVGAYATPAPGFIEAIAGTGTAGYSGDTGPATAARLRGGGQVRIASSTGNVVVADSADNAVRVLAQQTATFYGVPMTADHIYTIAGNGTAGYSGDTGPGPSAELDDPQGIAVDSGGDVIIADTNNNVIRVVPMSSGTFFGYPYLAGHIYTLAGDHASGFSGDGGPALSAEFSGPFGVAVDNAVPPNLVIADSGNNRLRVMAGSTGAFYGRSMTMLDVYTIAGTALGGFSGDGKPAAVAQLGFPTGVTVDPSGSVLFADSLNSRVRAVAGASATFYGVKMAAGRMYTVAGDGSGTFGEGSPATTTGVSLPGDVALDGAGNLVIAGFGADRILLVAVISNTDYGVAMTAGDIYTIAGNGTTGTSGDGGLATSAEVDGPSGVAVDGSGNVVIEDLGSSEIRAVAGTHCSTGGGSDPQLQVTSSAEIPTLTPGTASYWTATVSNTSGAAETCVLAHFTVDAGSLSSLYGLVNGSQGGCTFTAVSGGNAGAVDCLVGALDAGASATASVDIQTVGLKSGAVVNATVDVASTIGSGGTDTEQVHVADPTPGVATSDVPPGGKLPTDKGTGPALATAARRATVVPGATIIAVMKLPKYVRPGFVSEGVVAPDRTILVPSLGSLIHLQRYRQNGLDGDPFPGLTTFCANACHGDVMELDQFHNYIDLAHPAALTLTWDSSVDVGVTDPAHTTNLYWATDSSPNGHALVPDCLRKVSGAYPAGSLPCVSKRVLNAKSQVVFTVQLLSTNDPGFVRR
jgi:hypothetical protein